jgi:hypothetical protein
MLGPGVLPTFLSASASHPSKNQHPTTSQLLRIHSRLYNPQGRLEGNLQDTEARNRIRQTKVNN